MEVLVVDDHPLTLEMLPEVLRGVFPGAIVHTAADLAGALGIARRERSLDYILLDLGLPDCKGLEGLTRIRQEFPRVRVVVVSASGESETILGALKAGAAGYIPKTEKTRVLAAALQLIAAGGIYVPGKLLSAMPAALPRARFSGREGQVLRLLRNGLSNREIAGKLRISENTVKQYVSAVFAKLGVSSRVGLLAGV